MLRRFLVGFLCFVLGFATCIASIVGVGWIAYSKISLESLEKSGIIEIDEETLRGEGAEVDITKLTLAGLVAEISKLSTLEEEVSINLLIDRYQLKLPEETLKLIPEGVRDLPVTDIFSDKGVETVLATTKVEYLYTFLPSDLLSDPAKEALKGKSLGEVAELNLTYLLSDVKIGYLTGVKYEKNDETGEYEPIYKNPDQPSLSELISEINAAELLDLFANGGDIAELIGKYMSEVLVSQFLGAFMDLSDLPLGGAMEGKTFGEVLIYDEATGVYNLSLSALLGGSFAEMLDLTPIYNDPASKDFVIGWQNSKGESVYGVMRGIAGKSLSDLLSGGFDVMKLMNDVYLGDVMSYRPVFDGNGEIVSWKDADEKAASGVMASLVELQLGELTDGSFDFASVLDGTYVGDLLGYTPVKDDPLDPERITGWTKDGVAVKGVDLAAAGIDLGRLMSDDTYDISTAFDSLRLGELLGYEKRGDSWYEAAGSDVEVARLYAEIADLSVGEMTAGGFDFATVFEDLYLGDVLGHMLDGGVWYEKNPDGTRGEQLSAVDATLAGISIGDRTDGGIDMATVFDGLYLGDLLGYTPIKDDPLDPERITGWTENGTALSGVDLAMANIDLGKMLGDDDYEVSSAFDSLLLGELLGYEKRGDSWYEAAGSDVEVSELYAAVADLSVGALMAGNADLEGTISGLYLGDLLNYEKVVNGTEITWYETRTDGSGNVILDGDGEPKLFEVSALYARIADLTVGEMTAPGFSFQSVFEGLLLGDVLGYTYESDAWYETKPDGTRGEKLGAIDAALSDMDLGELLRGDGFDLTSVFSNVYLGEALGYEKGEKTSADGDPERYRWYKIEKNPDGSTTRLGEIDGIEARLASYKLGALIDGSAEIKTEDLISGMSIGEIMGYTPYYKTDGDGEPTDEIDYWCDKNSVRVTGLMAAIAGEEITTLENGTLMSKIKLGDALGYYYDEDDCVWLVSAPIDGQPKPEKVSGIMGVLADEKVDQLGTAVDEVKIGEIMGYVEKNDGWYEVYDETDPSRNVKASGVMAAFAGLSVGKMSDSSAVTEAMNKVKLGDAMGYYYDTDSGSWLVSAPIDGQPKPAKVGGITAAFVDLTVGQMSDSGAVTGAVNGVTLGDALGYYYNKDNGKWYESAEPGAKVVGGVIGALVDTKIGDLSTRLESAKIGELLGYTYDGVWKDGETAVSPLINKICEARLDSLGSTLDALTLGDIFTAEEIDSTAFFKLLQDPATIKLEDIPEKATEAVQTATIGALMNAGLLKLADGTQSQLNAICTFGGKDASYWKTLTIEGFITFITSAIDK